jgi:hypothetical protein
LGVWGFGFGVGGLGPTPKSPIPNPQSPIPNPQYNIKLYYCFNNNNYLIMFILIIKPRIIKLFIYIFLTNLIETENNNS